MDLKPGDRLTTDDDPDGHGRNLLGDRLFEFNMATTGMRDGNLVSYFIHDESDTLVAGLWGWTWGGCLEIDLLWVRDDRRGLGYGTRLVAMAEDEARARGCHQALLDTHDFQAPSFYQRLGYDIYATLDDYPRGHQKHYLRKLLR